jgi:hypothetical protein
MMNLNDDDKHLSSLDGWMYEVAFEEYFLSIPSSQFQDLSHQNVLIKNLFVTIKEYKVKHCVAKSKALKIRRA